jgi:thioredoxin 1
MTLFSPEHHRNELAARLDAVAQAGGRLVACLCAEWCGTCKAYRQTFADLAQQHPADCFVWIDIETHADHLGDVDIENFPTLLIQSANRGTVQFYGTVLPHANVAARMLERNDESVGGGEEVPEVLAWLRTLPLPPGETGRAALAPAD